MCMNYSVKWLNNLLRFVNTVSDSKLDKQLIWTHIKTLRLNYLMKNTHLDCINNFIPGEEIRNNLEKLSQSIGGNITEEVDWNLSNNELHTWAEMFFKMNSCPSFYVKLYSKVIYGSKSRIPMLASNIIKRANLDFNIKAIKIFSKISSILGFQYISLYNEEKKSFEKNIVNVNGEITNMLKY